jgi:hypothetical protein
MQKRKIVTALLSVLTIVFATASWLSVRSAVIVPDSSTWAVPMALFSVYIILICLDVMLFQDILLLELVLIGSLATSVLFSFEWLQVLGILISAYFIFLSSRKIRLDMDNDIKISPWKSLQAGKSYLLISLIFLIAMQYFLTIRSFEGEKKIPFLDTSYITQKIVIPFVATVNPQFKALKNENLTVDQFFLLQMQGSLQDAEFMAINEEMIDAQLPANLTPVQRDVLKKQAMDEFSKTSTQIAQKNQELILQNGRKQIADFVGVPVSGSEKISEILTGPIDSKINEYFNAKMSGGEKNSMLPLIFSLVLLLIIYPLAAILSIIWFMIAKFIIFALLKLGAFTIKTIPVSKEILE